MKNYANDSTDVECIIYKTFNEYCVKIVRIRRFSALYFPLFRQNKGKYGPEKL